MTLDLAVFDIKGFEVMMTWKREYERSKYITQTHGGKNDEMRCPQPDTNVDECHVQERHTANITKDWFNFPPPFLASTQLFFKTSLKGITYACAISLSFEQIQPSKFYEP